MASSARQIVLSDEDILQYKANHRIVQIPPNHQENKYRKSFYLFCDNNDGVTNKKSRRVCLYNRVWHQSQITGGENFVGPPVTEVHNFDDPEETTQWQDKPDESANKDNTQKDVDQKIRNSPISTNISIARVFRRQASQQPISNTQHPTKPTMSSTTTATTTTTATATPSCSKTIQEITNVFQTGIRRAGGGSSGGGRGGGEGGGGGGSGGGSRGGGPPRGAAPAATQQPVAATKNVKETGEKLAIFDRDQTKADQFIEEVQQYLALNHLVLGFNSHLRNMMFTLTLIKGPNIARWVRDIGEIWRQLNDARDDVPAVWDQFLVEFRQQFQDTQKAERARIKLENLKMKDREIDSYCTFPSLRKSPEMQDTPLETPKLSTSSIGDYQGTSLWMCSNPHMFAPTRK